MAAAAGGGAASVGGGLSLAGAAVTDSLSLAVSGGSASGVEVATSGVEVEVTDIGGSGSLILDGEEGTDFGVAAGAGWLNRAPNWSPVGTRGRHRISARTALLSAWSLPSGCGRCRCRRLRFRRRDFSRIGFRYRSGRLVADFAH